jgi:hypothetical protein
MQPRIDDWNYGVLPHIPGHARLPSPPSPAAMFDAVTPYAEPNAITCAPVAATATRMCWPVPARRRDHNSLAILEDARQEQIRCDELVSASPGSCRVGVNNLNSRDMRDMRDMRQLRTFAPRARLHKNTVSLLALGYNQGRPNCQLRECVGR